MMCAAQHPFTWMAFCIFDLLHQSVSSVAFGGVGGVLMSCSSLTHTLHVPSPPFSTFLKKLTHFRLVFCFDASSFSFST